MKCEKCNKNESNFHYSCNFNGEKTETHLCSECAQASGYGELLNYRPMPMYDMLGSMMNNFFRPTYHPFLPSFGNFGGLRSAIMAPMMTMPQIRIMIGEPAADAEQAKTEKTEQVDAELNARRERNALKAQLEEAVKAENFEKAIELRDRLKALEA